LRPRRPHDEAAASLAARKLYAPHFVDLRLDMGFATASDKVDE
jgi:hypothetical protein